MDDNIDAECRAVDKKDVEEGAVDVRFDLFAEGAPDPICVINPEGAIRMWNPAAERFWGYRRAEALGRQVHALLGLDRSEGGVERRLADGAKKGATGECRGRRKNGEAVFFSISLSPILVNGVQHVVMLMRDITANKMVDEQLSAYSERLAQESHTLECIFEASPVGLLLVDTEYHIKLINTVAAHIVQQDAASMSGKSFGESLCCMHALTTPGGCGASESCASCPMRFAINEVLVEHRRVLGMEVQRDVAVSGQAASLWFCISAVPLTLGGIPHVLFALENITERKCAEAALRASEAKFRGLFELSPIGIALNDFQTGAWLDFNQAILKPTDYSAEEFRALSYFDVTPPEYAEQERAAKDAMIRTGYYGPFEKEYIRKDGSRYPVRLQGMKHMDASGREVIWSFIQDITEEKAAQQELVRLSITDPLTKAFNRIKIIQELERELDRAARYAQTFSLIMFDVDHFKHINDTYGHGLGDVVLIELTRLVQQLIRHSDVLARWGGEEFMLLAVNTPMESAALLAERLRIL